MPVFFVVLGTAVFGLLAAGGDAAPGRFVLMLLGMLGGQVAIGADNEWRDREHDALQQPDKPIPAGLVSLRAVRPIVVAGLIVCVVAGAALGFWPLALLLIGTASGFAYNIRFKRTPLSGIPYLIGLPLLPIWATLVMDGFEPQLLWLYPLGGAFVVAIHLAQSLPDIEGDRASGTRGLAVVLGRRRTVVVIWAIAFGTALVMPLGALAVAGSPLFALVAATAAGSLFGAFLAISSLRGELRADRQFAVLCAGATILAAGWILSLTG